jgi:hypothetical protein
MQSRVFGAVITGTDGRCVGADSGPAIRSRQHRDVVNSSRAHVVVFGVK